MNFRIIFRLGFRIVFFMTFVSLLGISTLADYAKNAAPHEHGANNNQIVGRALAKAIKKATGNEEENENMKTKTNK